MGHLLPNDLSQYLGAEYKGLWLNQFILASPKASLPIYHSVGALDPLTEADVKKPIGDGLPETLGQWIAYSGIDHIKIKLNGDDFHWDVNRVSHRDGHDLGRLPGGGPSTAVADRAV